MPANLRDCLLGAVEGREVERGRGEGAISTWEDLVDKYSTAYPITEAERLASIDLRDALRQNTFAAKRRRLEQLKTQRRMLSEYASADPIQLVLDMERTGKARDAIMRQVSATIRGFLNEAHTGLLGRTKAPARVKNVLRELMNESTGDATAKEMAKAIDDAREWLRTMFNAHGGDIGRLDDFGVTHTHDARALSKAGFDNWAEAIAPRLNWERIVDFKTGKPFARDGRPPNAEAQKRMLGEIYENVVTGGWQDRDPSSQPGGRALYNRRSDARVLHFKSADDWIAYNDQFGSGDTFTAIVSHLQGMARDVALMKDWGPNPIAGLQFAGQVVERGQVLQRGLAAGEKARAKARHARVILEHLTGAANTPVNSAWAAFYAGARNVLTAAQLGSATLSTLTDLWTQRMAAASIGMGGGRPIRRAFGLMASQATQETAQAMGYIADSLADAGATSARYLGDVWSPEVTSRLSNFVLRVNLLNYWTDMNRVAFQMELGAYLAQNADKAFGALDAPLRKALQDAKIRPQDWDALRSAETLFTAPGGARFMSAHWFRQHSSLPRAEVEGLAIRLQTMFESEMEFAVPSVSMEGRTILIADAPPGTAIGELVRSTAMYKNFALSFTINQYRRMMAQPTPLSRMGYAAKLMAGATLLGAVGVQLKEIAKGNDPRPMDNRAFWGAAFMQGGGVGIFGDFFASETSRAGGGLAETLAGPVVGLAGDVTRLVASNAVRAASGEETYLGRDVTNFLRRYTPGTTIWYARLAFDRLVWDQMQDILDPDAEVAWRREYRRRQREWGTTSWWNRGEWFAERGPNLTNMMGAQQ